MNYLGTIHSDILNLILQYFNETELAGLDMTCQRFHRIAQKKRGTRGPRSLNKLFQEDNVYVIKRLPPVYNDMITYFSIITSYNAIKTFRWALRNCLLDKDNIMSMGSAFYDSHRNSVPSYSKRFLAAYKERNEGKSFFKTNFWNGIIGSIEREVTPNQSDLLNTILDIYPIGYDQFERCRHWLIVSDCSPNVIIRMIKMTHSNRGVEYRQRSDDFCLGNVKRLEEDFVSRALLGYLLLSPDQEKEILKHYTVFLKISSPSNESPVLSPQ